MTRSIGRWRLIAAATVLVLAAGCGSSTAPHVSSSGASAPVWLCDPQHPSGDPCMVPTTVTSVDASGARSPGSPPAPGAPARFACFYVYPTVSKETVTNADLRVQGPELAAARTQVSPFSSVCSVWAPMYRQVTLMALPRAFDGSSAADTAYESVAGSFRWWLAHDSHGLPIVFIGHSQGAAMLVRLLHDVVDPDPALRARVVSAILLGGDATVATGRTTGGSFRHLPICTAPAQVGCVVAYSTFPSEPPKDAVFGRPGQGVARLADTTAHDGLQVACTDPAALAGAGPPLFPLFPTSGPEVLSGITTRFVTYPGLYTARCEQRGGASWLQVTTSAASDDHRPRVRENLGPAWGYHVADVSLGLGDLVDLTAAQEASWSARR